MKPKIIFWGSPEFALPSLEACINHGEVLAVVTQPDKERGRGHELLPTEVKAEALKHSIPVYAPKSLRKIDDEAQRLLDFLEKKEADFFVVVAYGNLLPESVLKLPRKACVNVHGSLLPRWRGAAPIQRALEAGDLETGVCLQKMVQALDAGDVYLEKKYILQEEDNSASVFHKLSILGKELVADFLEQDFSKFHPQPQEESAVTLAKKIDKQEAYWTPSWTAAAINNRIRAFHSWPTVKLKFSDQDSKIHEVKIHKAQKAFDVKPQGTFFSAGKSVYLVGADGKPVELLSLQVPGKGPAEAFQVYQNILKNKWTLIS
jgi:methionyl-tRNA formyltransferase